ncbi:MAG: Crp/Fnr family transcriptional regulator [Chryseolinea sp.]
MWNLLFDNISAKGVVLTENDKQILRECFSNRKYRKHQYIVQEGDIVDHDYFIVKGLARTYRVDEKGQEHILRFTPEDWWAGDLASLFGKTPSLYNIDCIEDTEVLRISVNDLDKLFEKVPQMNKYFRILYQKSIVAFNLRVTANLTKSAKERYEEFVQRYPNVEQRVPDHQIASYLGIAPQSLSRIRGQRK